MYKKLFIIMLNIMLVFAMTGCGGSGKNGKNGDAGEAVKNYIFNELDLSFGSEESINYGYTQNGKIYYSESIYSDYPEEFYTEIDAIYNDESLSEEEKEAKVSELADGKYKDSLSEGKFVIKSYDIASGESKELFAKSSDTNSESYEKYYVNEDGIVTVFINHYEESADEDIEGGGIAGNMTRDGGEMTQAGYYIKKYAADGTEMSAVNLGEITSTAGEPGMLGSILFNRDGSVMFNYTTMDKVNYSTASGAVYMLDAGGSLVGKVVFDNPENLFVETLAFDEEGKPVVKWYDERSGGKLSYIDFEAGKIGEELTLETEDKTAQEDDMMGPFDRYTMLSLMNHKLLFKDSTYLYEYNKETKAMDIILKFMDTGVPADKIVDMGPTEDGKYACIIYNMDVTKFGVIEEGVDEANEKVTLKYASIYGSGMNVQEKIIKFNKTSDKYKIEFVSYENASSPEEAFANDIIAGNYPDIIDISNTDIESLINKGLLADLTPFMESDDVINKDYFVDGLMDAIAVDGKQYFIMKEFSLRTLVGKKSQLKDYVGDWTFENMMKYYATKKKGTYLSGINTKISAYTMMTEVNNPFINKKTGEVLFDSDLFAKYLELCNQFKNDDGIGEDEWSQYNEIEYVKKDKQIFSDGFIGGTIDIAMYNKIYNGDELYIGFPGAEKGNGTYITNSDIACGIMDTSEYKEGAWEFIKYIMTVDNTDNSGSDKHKYGTFSSDILSSGFNFGTFPANKVLFEELMKRDSTAKEYVAENGDTVYPRDEIMSLGDTDIKIGPATEEEIATLKDLIANASGFYLYFEREEDTIIMEEIEKYFSGDKSLKETQNVLQDRLKKFINENM